MCCIYSTIKFAITSNIKHAVNRHGRLSTVDDKASVMNVERRHITTASSAAAADRYIVPVIPLDPRPAAQSAAGSGFLTWTPSNVACQSLLHRRTL